MSELFREVDEALRQDRAAKFWKENGIYLIAFVLGTILLTAAFSGYKAWDTHTRQKQTSALLALQNAANYPENITTASLKNLAPGLRGIALLDAGGKYIADKKPQEALKFYEMGAADTKIPEDLHGLATLMSVRLLANTDTADGKDLLARLEPIWSDTKNIWASQARLEAAVISANKLGDLNTARTHLEAVQNTANLPDTVHEKARALDHVYALRQQKAAPKATQTDDKS
ncbi:MAG: hypothetical protein IT559_08030 [Alphaproteobacteria bacterium]|nr:hypothetical protein [Alphaproteobacteria bacterium]